MLDKFSESTRAVSRRRFFGGSIVGAAAMLSASVVFRLTDYVDAVLQPLSLYWEIDRRTPQREEARQAQLQLRRYRAAVRKFARRETSSAEGGQAASTTPTSIHGSGRGESASGGV